MITIYKYELPLLGENVLQMHADAKVLSVGVQGSKVCLWAIVNNEQPLVPRMILVTGTGNSLDMYALNINRYTNGFVGTISEGRYVWHVFDMGV